MDASTIDPMRPRLARVRSRRRDGPQVWTLEIDAGPEARSGFSAGQFNMLSALGVGEVPISFSGDPTEPRRIVHTIRAVGAVSTALAHLGVGATLGIRGPFGVGWPLAEAVGQDVVLVAGGLGLAPLRPAVYHLLAQRSRYGQITLLYGTRSPAEILFRRELNAWRRRADLSVEVTVDHALGAWDGHIGVVTALIERAHLAARHTTALVCGPEIMMRFAAEALAAALIPSESIYLSMERNMQCGVGLCGHCQFGGLLLCRDGPVIRYDRLRETLRVREL